MGNDLARHYDNIAVRSAQKGVKGYLQYLVCDTDPPRRLMGKTGCIEPWQETIYDLLAPMFDFSCGYSTYHVASPAAFICAPRGSAKTTCLAHFLCFALCFSKRPIYAIVAAASEKQAAILHRFCQSLANVNPWLKERLNFTKETITGPTGKATTTASQVSTSSGELCNLIVADELTWWEDQQFWDQLDTISMKKPNCSLVVISNSGVSQSWQWKIWQNAQESPRWVAHSVPAYSASWISKEGVADQRKYISPSMYARLWENRWLDPNEENPFITKEELAPCVNYQRQDKGKHYAVAAIDYGAHKDFTAACVCHMEGEHIYLDEIRRWKGTPDNRVKLYDVEAWLNEKLRHHQIKKLVVDPTQLEQMCQTFEGKVNIQRESFRGRNHQRLAENLASLITNRRLHLYDDPDLFRELTTLQVVPKIDGSWRVNHRPGEHDDCYCVLSLAALALVEARKINPLAFLEKMNELESKPIEEETMQWKNIKHFSTYGSYAPTPTIQGMVVVLKDYTKSVEAAYAANVVAKLLGDEEPNPIPVGQVDAKRAATIEAEVKEQLEQRRLLPEKDERKKK